MNKREVIEAIKVKLLEEFEASPSEEAKRNLLVMGLFPVVDYSKQTLVEPGALVRLRAEGAPRSALYLIVPQLTGLVFEHEGVALQILSPESKLGSALLGRNKSDWVDVGSRRFEILEVL